mmetsp:Transcript_39770/g.78382  ORF Transcript_39770/g.78382 Transcript_39770/m.78382 type:complete len:270 (+) Transcript_39770:1799-2608(+)
MLVEQNGGLLNRPLGLPVCCPDHLDVSRFLPCNRDGLLNDIVHLKFPDGEEGREHCRLESAPPRHALIHLECLRRLPAKELGDGRLDPGRARSASNQLDKLHVFSCDAGCFEDVGEDFLQSGSVPLTHGLIVFSLQVPRQVLILHQTLNRNRGVSVGRQNLLHLPTRLFELESGLRILEGVEFELFLELPCEMFHDLPVKLHPSKSLVVLRGENLQLPLEEFGQGHGEVSVPDVRERHVGRLCLGEVAVPVDTIVQGSCGVFIHDSQAV